MNNLPNLQEIVSRYKIGPVVSVTEVQRPRHATYKINTLNGCYALQALHPDYSSDAVIGAHAAVLEHLKANSFPAPQLIETVNGQLFTEYLETRWRLVTWVEGDLVPILSQHYQLYSAASLLARFHLVMQGFSGILAVDERLFDVAHTLKRMREAVKKGRVDSIGRYWLGKTAEQITFIEAYLPGLIPSDFHGRIVHGHPQITNFVFSNEGEAQGIIGLDSCRQDSILVDLGQAICLWCQDQQDQRSGIHLSLPKMETLLMGYTQYPIEFDDLEMVHLPLAPLNFTLELAAQYLTDIFEDKKFPYDRGRFLNRRDHNFERLVQLINLAKELQANEQKIDDLIESIFNK